jgi:sterol desaturase/sphingolipid hydroxylase (fatty acid hydroxylase superfamily)
MRHLPNPIGLLISFFILAVIFFLLERKARRGQQIFRRGFWLDFSYWFFTPLVTGFISRLAVVLAALPLIALLGLSWNAFKNHAYHGFGPLSQQWMGLQALEIFLLGDLLGYWIHWLFHGRRLWSFHAVHHGSTDVDWLSSVRLHPVNEAVTRSVEVIPLLLLGFDPIALASYVPLITLYALLLHAKVNWTYGPLRYVIASPVFHRWHHAKEAEAIDKNFAGFFAFWDVLFGTFYLPANKLPTDFGVKEEIPESLWGQLVYPFRRRG